MSKWCPQRIGRVQFTVLARFDDGGYALRTVTADVKLLRRRRSFKAYSLPVLVLDLGMAQPVAILRPCARYQGIPDEVCLDSRFVHYTLLPSKGPPAVSLRPSGLVQALRPGDATIEARFGSAVDQVQVTVEPAGR